MACPLLAMFEFVQCMNMFSAPNFQTFMIYWLYRLAWNFVFRFALDPLIFNLQKFQMKVYNWLSNKAKHDEFYDKFLEYFAPKKRYFLHYK